MDKIKDIIKFQNIQLNYQFKNVDLLYKALTHSIDNSEIDKDFHLRNRTNQRLCVVGETVLKLVVSEFVTKNSNDWRVNQGDWTSEKNELVKLEKQVKIGKRLFHDFFSLLRIGQGNWSNPDFVVPYADFVKALFGAVFLDCGGSRGNGVATCLKLFQKLWKDFLNNGQEELKAFDHCFPLPDPEVKHYWIREGLLHPEFLNKLLQTLKVDNFLKIELLLEAIIHKTFYSPVQNKATFVGKRQPDYQKLEFLGDAILDVVLTEFHWRKFPEFSFTNLSTKARKLAEDEVQRKICEKLDIRKFVKLQNVEKWECLGDILEAIIGAIYVDQGMDKAKQFVLNSWDLPENFHPTTLWDLQCKLHHIFSTEEIILDSLTHQSYCALQSEKERAAERLEAYTLIGESAVKFILAKYIFQSLDLNSSPNKILLSMNSLCGPAVRTQIASYLNLSQFVRLSETLKSGNNRFKKFYLFVYPLLGVLFDDLKDKNDFAKFKEIVYRIWNPHLKNCPQQKLLDCFGTFSSHNCEESEKKTVFETDMEKIFQHHFPDSSPLNYHVMWPLHCRKCTTKDTIPSFTKFAILGSWVIQYYIVVKICQLKKPKDDLDTSAEDDLELLEHIIKTADVYDKLRDGFLGAVYVDMQAINSSDQDWLDYLEKIFPTWSLDKLISRLGVTRQNVGTSSNLHVGVTGNNKGKVRSHQNRTEPTTVFSNDVIEPSNPPLENTSTAASSMKPCGSMKEQTETLHRQVSSRCVPEGRSFLQAATNQPSTFTTSVKNRHESSDFFKESGNELYITKDILVVSSCHRAKILRGQLLELWSVVERIYPKSVHFTECASRYRVISCLYPSQYRKTTESEDEYLSYVTHFANSSISCASFFTAAYLWQLIVENFNPVKHQKHKWLAVFAKDSRLSLAMKTILELVNSSEMRDLFTAQHMAVFRWLSSLEEDKLRTFFLYSGGSQEKLELMEDISQKYKIIVKTALSLLSEDERRSNAIRTKISFEISSASVYIVKNPGRSRSVPQRYFEFFSCGWLWRIVTWFPSALQPVIAWPLTLCHIYLISCGGSALIALILGLVKK